MQDYEIFDAHTHVHVPARDGAIFLGALRSKLPRTGSPEECIGRMDRAGIRKSMIVPWIPAKQIFEKRLAGASARGKPDREALLQDLNKQWSTYNRWAAGAASNYHGRFASLVGLDPVLFGPERTRQEIDARIGEGAVGLKIVPGFIGAYPNDDRMAVLWEEAHRRELPVLSRAVADFSPDYDHPMHFEEVLKAYPKCRIVMAHVGRGAEEHVVRLTNRYPNLYCDTSMWLSLVGPSGKWSLEAAAALFRRIGIDRILFATNYPFYDPPDFVDVILHLPLTDDERRQIFTGNFRRVYGDAQQPSQKPAKLSP